MIQTLELPVSGMDCAACARKAQRALMRVPGVQSADVLLNAEKAVIQFDTDAATPDALRATIEKVGFSVPQPLAAAEDETPDHLLQAKALQRQLFATLGLLFGTILFVVVIGEGLGLFEKITESVPWWAGLLAVLAFGYPIFKDVLASALRREVTSHTLMSVGAVAALAIGQWATAAIVVFFMRVGEFTERFTSERARRLLKEMTALVPQTARVQRDGGEREVAIETVVPGDVIIVRPGERVPVDGVVLEGQATLDQAAITGESMPVEAEAGDRVYAATLARLGHVKLRAERIGRDTTFGRALQLVEDAEANRGKVQRVADRFSAWYLPVVATIALLTWLLSGNILATVAVLVVACSCSFALATPIAMMASVGAAARQGLLIKGGKVIEALVQCDVMLVDKTGTLTTGNPRITDVVPLGRLDENTLLHLAAAAERHSEHPLAEAVRALAAERGMPAQEPDRFEARPGRGVRAEIEGLTVEIGNRRMLEDASANTGASAAADAAQRLEGEGKTLLFMVVDGQLAGLFAAQDTLRPEVADALAAVRAAGIGRIELLTGDNERTAAAIAAPLGLGYRAGLLPEDKINIVREWQQQGHRVVMVGDGVNDAPALAQADVGIAMGGGTDVAMEAAQIVLMREDWRLVAESVRIARRTMGVVRTNIGFTALYNLVGLSLAAFGLLPPIYAAALQSIPDIGILANSSRLIRNRGATDD
ncbi:cation-translocating P-type ATPase [Diaphorobacter sp. JS3051]|uniref:heavy metal translocating P-type ATPase n=1 Tax=Diaphorobacter sp. JS3051 TaxID=2792224 RepID=UPI0018CB279C|nr:cation-translocating P-type ATPase [Diaphorobacter sp. JS3051]QPN33429.1 cation-translocating P-type ATPase [Diaphorobacter sp. JS3051]